MANFWTKNVQKAAKYYFFEEKISEQRVFGASNMYAKFWLDWIFIAFKVGRWQAFFLHYFQQFQWFTVSKIMTHHEL